MQMQIMQKHQGITIQRILLSVDVREKQYQYVNPSLTSVSQ